MDMYTNISVELLTNQKVKEAHRIADQYKPLDQEIENKHGLSRFTGGFLSWIFRKPGLNKDNQQINAKGSAV
jgi:hypothetical protein